MNPSTGPDHSPSAVEPRIILEDGLEARIAAIVEPVVEQLDYRLVRIRLSQMNGLTLQIMAERADGTMSVDDCEAISRAVSPVLDMEDPIDREYHLEVSSPGIDRPLVRRGDFEAWSHHLLKLEATRIVEGRKRFRGKVVAVEAHGIRLERSEVQPGEDEVVSIPFDAIADARLLLTDELIDAALKADKAARKGLVGNDNDNDPGDDAEA
ncbi:ribosome maturation factor RimP [Aureimonas sp. Leaf454]|uniref:ribosome maturation factor RimP n=1 Tax=Aureimonas sp. Leaf454 TaxID=1736381 RepID=UPI0006FC881D|nr:ribosome maturation factor RimP [Aureimonas sp. Leaf454]KQT43121.1 ribosome maturation factor RimP [Aureimonas sp. Leaf454]